MSVALRLVPDELGPLFAPFRLADRALLDRRTLLRRVDTKFAVPLATLPAIAGALAPDYAVLAMPAAFATYRSLYFDTPALRCFHDHRRGRRIRHKIRIRQYVDRRAAVLEVKTRKTELVCDKQRVELDFGQVFVAPLQRAFLRQHVEYADELRPQLWIDYRRVMLLGLAHEERVTIDVDLEARTLGGTTVSLDGVAIVEVKQAAWSPHTPVMRALAAAGLRACSSSKYVAAIAKLRPDVPKNRLLPALRTFGRTR